MRTLIKIWCLLDRKQRRRMLALQALSLLMAFSTLGGVAAILPFFTVLSDPESVRRSAILIWLYNSLGFHNDQSFEVILGVGFVGIILLANTINLFGSVAMNNFAFSIGSELHVSLFREYLYRRYDFHARTSSATLVSKVIHEVGRVTNGILQNSLILVTNFVTIIVILSTVFIINPLVAVTAIAGLGTIYTLVYIIARRKLRSNGKIESTQFEERLKITNEGFSAIKEIIVLNRQNFFIGAFTRSCDALTTTYENTLTIAYSPKPVLEFLTVAGLVGTSLLLQTHNAHGNHWLAQLTFIAFAAYRLLPALQLLFSAVVRIRADYPAFESIFGDLYVARFRRHNVKHETYNTTLQGLPRKELSLSSVSFRYCADRPKSVNNVTLQIPAGAMIGIIGANGSGKTTLADLMLGLLKPDSGHISIDGMLLDDTNRDAWQLNVAYVPQQILLLDSSVAQNIAFGVTDEEINQQRVLEVARHVRLDEFIVTLPGQYNEVLGERGVKVSGGQRQLIGIARALYRNASIIILDEATSFLDASTEKEVMAAFQKLRGQRTIVMITHHLTLLERCDLIVELEKGTLLRSGTFSDFVRDPEPPQRRAGI